MKIRKLAIGISLSSLFCLNVSSISAEEAHNYQPEEKVVNGVTYLDGIPLLSSEDIQELDIKQKSNIVIGPRKKAGFTTQGYETWTSTGYSHYYTAQDYDTLNVYGTAPSSHTLRAKSSATTSITGSTGFNFAEVVKAEIGFESNKTWEKEYETVIKPTTNYVYTLKSAAKVKQTNWEYYDDTFFGSKTYQSSTHGNAGTERWFYSHPL